MVEYVTRDEFGRFAKDVATRFDGVDERFVAIDKRFDGIDKRLDGIDKRLDGIDKRLDGIDKRFDTFEQRIMDVLGRFVIEVDASIARHVGASEERIRAEIRGVDDQDRDLPERVTRLEEHTGLKR